MRVKFSEEFRRDAVALVLSQGASKSALQAWVRDAELVGREIVSSTSGDVDGRELTPMLRRIRELEIENEILRETVAHLSQPPLRSGSTSQK